MKNDHYPWRTIIWITLFSIAMGFLETSVVVYLRAMMYPNGFNFPLAPIPQSLALTEVIREAATIIMLIGAGFMAGKSFVTRFGYFIYAFAIWDIFYYIFLKLVLNWPDSWFTWDILFLIPVVWVGPVIAPLITSATMVGFFFVIIHKSITAPTIQIDWKNWGLLVLGSIILITSFAWDYALYIIENKNFCSIWIFPTKDLPGLSQQYIPQTFNWLMFWVGEAIISFAILRFNKSR